MPRFIILFMLFLNFNAGAITTIQINKGHHKPTPIAINHIDGNNTDELDIGHYA